MPVTAKLSQKFYEKLGDEVASELVNWFNDVDATYRSDLREMNELNFARYDAKLGQRFAEQDARWERRFAEQDAKWERRFAELEARVDQRFVEQDAKWERRIGSLEVRVERGFANFMKWMFVFWAGNVATTIGIIAVALKLAR